MSSRDAGIFLAGAGVGAAAAIIVEKLHRAGSDDQPIIMGGGSLHVIPTGRKHFAPNGSDAKSVVLHDPHRTVKCFDVITTQGLDPKQVQGRPFRADITYKQGADNHTLVLQCEPRRMRFVVSSSEDLVPQYLTRSGHISMPDAAIESVNVYGIPYLGLTDLILHWKS